MNEGPYDPIPDGYSVFINSDKSLVICNSNGAPDLSFYLICTSNEGFTSTKKVSVSFKKYNKAPEFASKLNKSKFISLSIL